MKMSTIETSERELLTTSQQLVLLHLRGITNHASQCGTYLTLRNLSGELRLSDKTIGRALKHLVAQGFVRMEIQGRNRYYKAVK